MHMFWVVQQRCFCSMWSGWAAHLVSGHTVICPSLALSGPSSGDDVGMCCSWTAEATCLTLVCSGCCVLSKGLLFSAEYEAAMDRKFGLEPGTLFQGLKKVGWVTGTSTFYFVAIMQTLCLRSSCSPELLIWLQRFVLMWIVIVNFSLFVSKEEEGLLSVSRSENHNQYFVSFLDLWPKCFSFVTSLSNLLFYCLALKADHP